jgi:iron(III) transport system permease protein
MSKSAAPAPLDDPLVDPLLAPSPAPAHQGGRGRWAERLTTWLQTRNLVLLAVVLIIGYLALVPLLYLLYGTFFPEDEFTTGAVERAFSAPGVGAMVRNSIVFAVGSAVVAFVSGTFLAYVTVRTNVRFKGLLFAAAMIPLIIPGILYTIAWILLASGEIGVLNQISDALIGRNVFNVFSMGGMMWVQGTHTAPLVFLFMVAAFRSMDPSLEESALVSGASRMRMIMRITVPLVRPAIAGALLIMVLRGLEGFEVPALLGSPEGIYVFTSQIFLVVRNYPPDTAAAGALALGLLTLAAIGVYLVNRFGAKGNQFGTVTGKGFRPRPLDLGRARGPISALVVVYFVVTTVLPILVMAYASLLPFYQSFSTDVFETMTLDNYRDLFAAKDFSRAVVNSVVLGVGSATFVTVVTAIAAWLVARTKMRGRQVVDQLAFLPLVVPGLVLGLSISFVYLRNPLPFPVYGTLLILGIAYVTGFLPYGMRYAVAAMHQISTELEESAHVSGATWWQTFRRVLLPLMVPGLLAGWIYVFIVSVRELSSSILLYSPGKEVLAILTFQLYEDGKLTTVAALGVVMVTGLVLIVTIAYKLGAKVGLR